VNNFKPKIKIFVTLFLILNISFFIYTSIKKTKNQTYLKSELVDITKILKYGEILKNIKLSDRYGSIFDLDDYNVKPILFVFVKFTNEQLNILNKGLCYNLKSYFSRGLNIIYVTVNKEKIENSKELILFYDTDDHQFFETFKVQKCCGAVILLDKNHRVVLSTPNILSAALIKEILENKVDSLF
jgi:hypothetical protein